MSKINVTPFFKFCRVKVMNQVFDTKAEEVRIQIKPDERFKPICSRCRKRAEEIHSFNHRSVRDLNIFHARTSLFVTYRTVKCATCGTVVEYVPLLEPYKRVTRRLADYILELCRHMSIKEVAEHLKLNWKTVKAIHKRYLKEKFSQRKNNQN